MKTFNCRIRGHQKKYEWLRGLKEFLPQIFAWGGGGVTMFLVKQDLVKENMLFRAHFQMLILACFSQATNEYLVL